MKSFGTFLTASFFLGLAAASPVERSYQTCTAPKEWHVCGDGWKGCCSVSPCRGPAEGVKSGCPDDETPVTPTQPPTTPTSVTPSSTSLIPSATPSRAATDDVWMESCKEDDSDCNWSPNFYVINNNNQTYSTANRTRQFFVQKEAGGFGKRYDSIAVFSDIPDHVTRCRMNWYKPEKGIFYGTFGSGSMNISILDMGGKTFADAVGEKEVTWEKTKKYIEKEENHGALDLANWGWFIGGKVLSNGAEFDCKEKELVVHFALNEAFEGAVIVDQVSNDTALSNNGFVTRAGWFLSYKE